MMGVSGVSRFAWHYSNTVSPLTSPGTAFTPANGSKGSWTDLLTGANVANDVYAIWVHVCNGNTNATARPLRIDIGVDPAGGTAYVARIADLLGGCAGALAAGLGHTYYFPLFMKAGSSIGVRAQGIETATSRAWIRVFGRPTNPGLIRTGMWSETVGTPSGADGVSFTPGDSLAEGSWASLGTSVRACWWWQVSVGIQNTVMNGGTLWVDLAWGDGTNKTMIQENVMVRVPITAEALIVQNGQIGFADVPAGATIYVRAASSRATPQDTGWTALAHGIGG